MVNRVPCVKSCVLHTALGNNVDPQLFLGWIVRHQNVHYILGQALDLSG